MRTLIYKQNESFIWDSWSIDNWKSGRYWLHLGNNHKIINFEWAFKLWTFGIRLGLNTRDERGISLYIGIPLIGNFYFTFERLLPDKLTPSVYVKRFSKPGEMWNMPIGREIGISIFDSKIWVSLWSNPMEWNNKDPWWWEFTIDPVRLIFGQIKYSEKTLSIKSVIVPMPEGDYEGNVRIFESTWKRTRWPFAKRQIRSKIEIKNGIPVPGKGTTAYNLDDDKVFSNTSSKKTVREAIDNLIISIIKTRLKYQGNPRWGKND